jgi:hypothetical protein
MHFLDHEFWQLSHKWVNPVKVCKAGWIAGKFEMWFIALPIAADQYFS